MKYPLSVREVCLGQIVFTTKESRTWKSYLQDLGELIAEAWRDDLTDEADRAWAKAHREEFAPWVDERPAPPWPMLIAAVKRAFLTSRETLQREPTEAERLARLDRTYLWKTLTAHDVPQGEGPEALRAFQRGWRVGRRKKAPSMKNIPPVVDPDYYWYSYALKEANFPGPSAARERALIPSWHDSKDLKERQAFRQAMRELYASAWRADVPEEDREWAEAYREWCANWINHDRRRAVAESAYEAYLQSSDGILDGEPAPPWSRLNGLKTDPWRAVVDRIEDAPEGESEEATAAAAACEYHDSLWREIPPWDSDPTQAHWLAAVRAARKKSAELVDYVPRTI